KKELNSENLRELLAEALRGDNSLFYCCSTIILSLHEEWTSRGEKRDKEKSGLTLSGDSGQMKTRHLQDKAGPAENRSPLYEHCCPDLWKSTEEFRRARGADWSG